MEDNTDKLDTIFSAGGKEIIRLSPNGDIFVKGNLIENDKEFVIALREWFLGVKNG